MTPAAATIITPLALEYATGKPPVVYLSGAGEHVEWMEGRGRADLLLIAPATANTLSKVALGVDDTALTTFASVALGSGVPIVVAPAMHDVMTRNPAVKKRLDELRTMGVTFVEPRVEEAKAKIATAEEIADACIHRLAKGPWVGRTVLVVSGSTAERLDPVRVLTNRSSGRMGVELATAAYRAGADVTLWNAWGAVPLPRFAHIERFETVEDAMTLAKGAGVSGFDAIFVPAALGDFAPTPAKAKISSDAPAPPLTLRALPKVLPVLRRRAPKAALIGFKAESDGRKLIPRARERLRQYDADLMVANTADAFGAASATVFLVDGHAAKRIHGSKADIAQKILAGAANKLRR